MDNEFDQMISERVALLEKNKETRLKIAAAVDEFGLESEQASEAITEISHIHGLIKEVDLKIAASAQV